MKRKRKKNKKEFMYIYKENPFFFFKQSKLT